MVIGTFMVLAITYLPLAIPLLIVISMVVAYLIHCYREEKEYRNVMG